MFSKAHALRVEVLLLLLLSAIVAVLFNQYSGHGLAWIKSAPGIVTVADTSAAGELILPPINFTPGRDANFPAHPPIGPTLSQAYQSFQTQQAVFIDARAPALFAAGHIPGAWSLPAPRAEILPELSQKIPRNQLLIVYGQEGENVAQRSAQALRAAGYTQLRIMDQGFDSWRAAGFPVSETR